MSALSGLPFLPWVIWAIAFAVDPKWQRKILHLAINRSSRRVATEF
jgi:hypothetical protein